MPTNFPLPVSMPAVDSEVELIKQAQHGDVDAFCALARTYQRRVYALARHFCRNSHDAEDLSQEVWLRAYSALATFRFESSFYTWLRTITVHCFLNYQRAATTVNEKRKLRLVSLEAPDREVDYSSENPLARIEDSILAGRVVDALTELPPQQRMIFLLKHVEGMTYQEIGTVIGTSTGSVKKALFRAVTKLRKKLVTKVDQYDYVARAAGDY